MVNVSNLEFLFLQITQAEWLFPEDNMGKGITLGLLTDLVSDLEDFAGGS